MSISPIGSLSLTSASASVATGGTPSSGATVTGDGNSTTAAASGGGHYRYSRGGSYSGVSGSGAGLCGGALQNESHAFGSSGGSSGGGTSASSTSSTASHPQSSTPITTENNLSSPRTGKTAASSSPSSVSMSMPSLSEGVSMTGAASPSSATATALSPGALHRRGLSQLATNSTSSPRSTNRLLSPKNHLVLPDHIAALVGRWDGECNIHGGANVSDGNGNGGTMASEKTNVWLGCHLAFSPLDATITIEHPHNDAALCNANYRIRGHGHSIGTIDGSTRKLIPFSLNGLLDGSSGAFEMTVTGSEGEYQNALVSHGTVDFANRSMLADSKGRAGTLRLSFSGNQNTMTSTLRPHLSPKAVAKHLGLLSSAECGSGRPRSGAVLAKVITPAIAPSTPLQTLTPGTTSGPDPLTHLTKEGTVRQWCGSLVRHGTEHTAILSECVLAFNVTNDVGTIIGTGMASWEGYRVPFTLEGSFDHKHRVTVVWAEVAVKLMTEPPQCEKYTVSIDVANRRVEGHNAFGRLKLEPWNGQALPVPVPVVAVPVAVAPPKMGAVGADGVPQPNNIATTMVPTMMSQPPYPVAGGPFNEASSTTTGAGGVDGSGSYGSSSGMMYGPQMTPQGITYTLMPTAMAMQAHAVTAQMLYGSNGNNGGYPPYPPHGADDSSMVAGESPPTEDGNYFNSDSSDASATPESGSTPSDGRSRSNSSTSGSNSGGGSNPSSGPGSPSLSGTTTSGPSGVAGGGNVSIDPSLPIVALDESGSPIRPRRYSVTTTPRNRSGSDAAAASNGTNSNNNAPLQQFEIGDRVYMYTLPSNIVQSVLLRGPITAQALRDSPYPYHSPRQLHFNPGVLVRSEKRGSGNNGNSNGNGRRPSQSRTPSATTPTTTGAPVKERRPSGGSSSNSNSASPLTTPCESPNPGASTPSAHVAPLPQQRVVGMSPNPNAAGGKRATNKWPSIKAVRATAAAQ